MERCELRCYRAHTHCFPHPFLHARVHVCVCGGGRGALSRLSHVWLFSIPWTVAHPASLSFGFSRQEYWSGMLYPLSGYIPHSGIKPSSCMKGHSQVCWSYVWFFGKHGFLPLGIFWLVSWTCVKSLQDKAAVEDQEKLTGLDHRGCKASAAFMPTVSQQQKTMPAAFVRLRDKELSAENKVDDIRHSCPLLKCQPLT